MSKRKPTDTPTNALKDATRVKLNVGGVHHEVSRSLLDVGEDDSPTMLSRLVSETWNKNTPEEEAVFIDRNGHLFTHILDYLRYGQVSLPLTVSREAFLRDADYYGIDVDPGKVNMSGAGALAAQYASQCTDKLKAQGELVLRRGQHMRLAAEVMDYYILSRSTNTSRSFKAKFCTVCNCPPHSHRKLPADFRNIKPKVRLLNEFLSDFGLIVTDAHGFADVAVAFADAYESRDSFTRGVEITFQVANGAKLSG